MEHALVAARNAVGDRPHTLVAQIKTYLAGAYARAGKLDEAERLLDEVSAMRMALGETAGNKVAVLIERAEIARMRGQFAAGLELIDRGLELAMHVSAATQAMCHRLRAMFLLLQDRPVEGEAPARAALALSPHLAHERVLALQHLGWALRGQGRIDEAMTTFRAAEAELAAHFPAGHWISPFVHGHLGTMLYHADKREEALGHLQRASEEHAASSGRLSNDALTSLSNYATTLTRLGRAEARGVVERAISSFTEAKHDPDPMFMSLLRQASDLAEAAGDLPMALDRALQLVDQQRRTGAPTAIRANTELRVAELQHKLGSPAKSALATAVALAAEVTNDPELQQRIVEVAARLDAGERK
jgi:tetratricopeptide (TPR) repeat protein